jgi:hypothetical protein
MGTDRNTTGAKADYVIYEANVITSVFSETRSEYIWRKAVGHPAERFGSPRQYVQKVLDGMFIERDVAVSVRGNCHVFCDIFRPENEEEKVSPLIAWTVFVPLY